MIPTIFKIARLVVALLCCSGMLAKTACCQDTGRASQSAFSAACRGNPPGGNSKNATLDAMIVAAEQIVGPLATEDRCAIYERALRKLTGLEISSAELSDLQLLSTLTNLESLKLSNNHIADLSPMANLKDLVFLDITSNRVSDLTPLSGMTKLTFLRASGNQISDLKPLQNLPQLSLVRLENNSIHDVKPLAVLNADLISLSHNQITDIGELSRMPKVIRIYANSNKIPIVSDFKPPATLMIINLSDNPVSDDEIALLSQKMGIPDQYGNKRVVFTRDDQYNKDIDFVPTSRIVKVKLQ